MADYTIDKIHYGSDTYFLKDSNALYLTDEGNLKIDGTIAADKGIFNKLIATTADIGTLDVDDLTAQNATVVGLLDVEGEMHTNTWTNANIANIGGTFYIAPTVNCEIASSDTPMTIAISGNVNNRTIEVSNGNFITDSVEAIGGYIETEDTVYNSEKTYYYVDDGSYVEFTGSTFVSGTTYYEFNTDTYIVKWSIGSKVMLTGSVKTSTSMEYPLGTCVGVLNTPLNSTGFRLVSVNSNALETIILNLGTNLQSRDIKLSMYEIGPSTVSKPIGILMTSYGIDKSTYIDVYGGVNEKKELGYVEPNVRIGYLGGIPQYKDTMGATHKPTGWGIYTDNGYFRGVIVADSGSIGGFSINNFELSSGGKTDVIGLDTGTYLGPAGFGISNGQESNTTFFTATAVSIGGLITWNAPTETDDKNTLIIKADELTLGIEEYVETEDTIYNLNKTYYYIENDSYIEFTGDTFQSGVTYYELKVPIEVGSSLTNAISVNEEQAEYITNLNTALGLVTGMVNKYSSFIEPFIDEENTQNSYIDFQYKNEQQYNPKIKITTNTINFSLENDNNIITQISNNLMHTTFGEFENLRMRTGNKGDLTWIARSNGHLSLKVVK